MFFSPVCSLFCLYVTCLRLTLDRGRTAADVPALGDTGRVPQRVEAGAFFNTDIVAERVFLLSSLRHGAGAARDGTVLDAGLQSGLPLAPYALLGVALTAGWIDRAYARTYFGVTPAQAQAGGLAVYAPGTGVRDARLDLSLSGEVGDFSYGIDLMLARLAALVRTSPLSTHRTAQALYAGVAWRVR
jgi:outer membrane protein